VPQKKDKMKGAKLGNAKLGNAKLGNAKIGGRYWTRTSDPYHVKVVL
jgi:hypothetical protein